MSIFAAANISLSKVDHPAVRNFLQTRVENGDAIPQAHQLQECYLKREFANKKEVVFEKVVNKPVAIICDEMSDDVGRLVFFFFLIDNVCRN